MRPARSRQLTLHSLWLVTAAHLSSPDCPLTTSDACRNET
ncbi:hypothetical protein UO65_0877 [Actinokineospora spheciospongiae]|uniref:Uncharacterized protein n=1 Tax=Actinokineospora spheciospongiae TaxID=909613 RepID=W7ITV1_9PSEU|nr:hypothetical protein UO65_0877 [Actinokineospora spheciospongiae]